MESKDPKDKEEVKPEEQKGIPSVVGISEAKRSTQFFIFGLISIGLLYFIFKLEKNKKEEKAAREAALEASVTTYAPISALPNETRITPDMIPQTIVTNTSSDSKNLRDIRYKSPLVIFKGVGTQSVQASAGSVIGQRSAPGTLQGQGTPPQTGAPVPAGFTESNVSKSVATSMGNREYVMAQGKLIDAVLETAINSDHPGMIRGLISQDIYGDTGRTILLPRGSRLIGQYASAVLRGQNRVFVIWQRAIRPDGVDVILDSAATDGLGNTGIEGSVNNHFFTIFGVATALSVIGASASTVGVSTNDQNNSLAAFRSELSQNFGQAANTVLGEFSKIKPTITVRPGAIVKVFLAKDIYFEPGLGYNQVRIIQ